MTVALALLAIADRTAHSGEDLAEVVARGVAVLARNDDSHEPVYDYDDSYGWGCHGGDADALFTPDSVAELLSRVVATLASMGGVGSFGVFTPAVRRLAHAALVRATAKLLLEPGGRSDSRHLVVALSKSND